MSLAIVFKGPEGIVFAADSRATLTAQIKGQQNMMFPASFDNATKLLYVNPQKWVGVVTYGCGALGEKEPRTAHSFISEFESTLSKKVKKKQSRRLTVQRFTQDLSDFFMKQWGNLMPKNYKGPAMVFLIGGYDQDAPYGRIFEISIPSKPQPKEWHSGSFGAVWGGQREYTDRVLKGFDPAALEILKQSLKLTDKKLKAVENELENNLSVLIPYQFLPLQDCVDLSIFLIRMTITLHQWIIGVRGVGGAIDVATITKTDGFQPIQQKKILGERLG
ncbi:hypothetical protein MYX82_08085 [Acidobacteria bacterium AH-259-D05]|nr:hypothetical protein [Acidobacteria bacterium AH-259-D05]